MTDPNLILKHAVEDILQKINSDRLPPQSAVEKTAREYDLNPHMIKRATEVINVALTYDHFKKHADARDQDFPIVDYSKVIGSVFGRQEKTAAQLRSEWFPELPEVEPVDFNRALYDENYKTASVTLENQAKNAANTQFDLSLRGVFDKCAAYIEKLETELSELQTKEAGLNASHSRALYSLIEKFARDANYRTPFGEFESQVFSTIGERSVPYLDLIYKAAELSEERGVHDEKYQLFQMSKEASAFVDFLKQVDEFKKVAADVLDAEHNLKFEKDAMIEAYRKSKQVSVDAPNETVQATVPPVSSPDTGDPILDSLKKHKENPSGEQLDESVLTPGQRKLPHKLKKSIIAAKKKYAEENQIEEAVEALSPLTKEAFGWDDATKAFQTKMKDSSSPGSDIPTNSAIDNQERVLMLQELMKTDPILSTTEPHKIGQAYEQFLRIAPELSKEKEIVRAHLRGAVQGQALSPYDAEQYIKTNTAMIQQRKLQEGKPVSTKQ